MRNKYEFDYGIIVKFDPSYVKYLVDARKSVDNDYYDEEKSDEPLQLRNDIMDLVRGVRRVDGGSDLSEEEQIVINQMHEKVSDGNTMKRSDIENEITLNIQARKKDSAPTINYVLKDEFLDYPITYTNPNQLMIEPPKNVLAPGSIMWKDTNLRYDISYGMEHIYDVVTLIKHRVYERDGKVCLLYSTFRFDRMKQVTTEITKAFRMMIYNTKTGKLYCMSRIPKKGKRHIQTIKQSGININNIDILAYDKLLLNNFVKMVILNVTKDIPDVHIPAYTKLTLNKGGRYGIQAVPHVYDNIRITLMALLLQKRVGKRIEWVDDANFILNIGFLRQTKYMEIVLHGGNDGDTVDNRNKDKAVYKKYKRKYLYKAFELLKVNTHPKTISKSLFGDYYLNIFHKMMIHQQDRHYLIGLIPDMVQLIALDKLDKEIYHYIVYVVNEYISGVEDYLSVINEIRHMLHALTTQALNELHQYNRPNERNIPQMCKSFIKIMKNIFNVDNGYTQVTWTLVRDTMVMANEFGIRLRINKFKSREDVREVHDRLAAYQNRDSNVSKKYEKYKFLQYKSPTKLYNGFEFRQLVTAAELVEESRSMHHCVSGYSFYCVEGKSLIYSMWNKRSWLTIEIDGTDLKLPIKQKYTILDKTVNNEEMLSIIEKWHKDLIDIHKYDKRPYSVAAREYGDLQGNILKLNHFNSVLSDNTNKYDDNEIKFINSAIKPLKAAIEKSKELLGLNMEVSNAAS